MTALLVAPADPALPRLAFALEPAAMEMLLARQAGPLLGPGVRVVSATLVRHKAGRRALVAYEVRGADGRSARLLGKLRAKGADTRTFELHRALWVEGFTGAARVAVPEAVARLLARARDAARVLDAEARPLHRDFYPDQVLLDGSRTWLLDLDLHALGHPAVDAGNYVAHLIELGLREAGCARHYNDAIAAFAATWLQAQGARYRRPLAACIALSLLRLAGISHRLPGRGHVTEPLLALATRRFAEEA